MKQRHHTAPANTRCRRTRHLRSVSVGCLAKMDGMVLQFYIKENIDVIIYYICHIMTIMCHYNVQIISECKFCSFCIHF